MVDSRWQADCVRCLGQCRIPVNDETGGIVLECIT